MRITVKKGLGQSYAEVLTAARDNLPLAAVSIKAVRTCKAMPGGVVLEVSED